MFSQRKRNRLKGYDYSTPGSYFLTICTRNHLQLFGETNKDEMILNNAGKMIKRWWNKLHDKFSNIELDTYTVMPNHMHRIINIIVGDDLRVVPITVSQMIQWFKTMTTNKYIRNAKLRNWKIFHKTLWQRSFYDHIIRNDRSLEKIRDYITNNPLN